MVIFYYSHRTQTPSKTKGGNLKTFEGEKQEETEEKRERHTHGTAAVVLIEKDLQTVSRFQPCNISFTFAVRMSDLDFTDISTERKGSMVSYN